MDESTEHGSVEALLEPFGEGAPAGENLREDASTQSLYYRLRDARAEARAAERLADNDPELSAGVPPQWAAVAELARDALATRSKDVEVACWLTESLTRHRGLAGLAFGADLLGGLVAGFWSRGLYPPAEDDDPEGRLAAVTGLSGQDRDGSLLQPLRKTVLFTRGDGSPVTLWDYERSSALAALGNKGPGRAAADVVPFNDLEADARGPGLDALRDLARDAARAEASWKAFEAAVAATVPAEAQPSTGRARALLESLRGIAARYVPAGAEAGTAPEAAGEGAEVAGPAAAPAPMPAGDREALLDEVLRIARVFRTREPNSPISFTLEEAVRRARMPWPDLLRELVADGAARASMMTIAGLRAEAPAAQT